MQDINHCVSKALVENNPEYTLFVLEDLTGIRSATEKIKLKNRYVSVIGAMNLYRMGIDYLVPDTVTAE